MAAPVTTVSFTADVNSGEPPFDVQFTDTTIVTDGFARYWFWEFGDGAISTEQNPVHTYSGDPGEVYDVKLTVLATTDEFQALLFNDKAAVKETSGNGEQQNGLGNTEALAWDDYIADAPFSNDSSSAYWWLVRTGGIQRQYQRQDAEIKLETSFNNSFYLCMVSPSDMEIFTGNVELSSGGSVAYTNNTPKQEFSRLLGLSTTTPLIVTATVVPVEHLPDTTITNTQHGMRAEFWTRTYYPASTQDFDDHEELNFIAMGVPPVAEFSATPTKGFDPLQVQFTNLSTPAIGLPTTYSWRKRISGSGDPFTEFSIQEHPKETFTK